MQLGKSMGANIAKSRYSLQKPISNQAYIRHQPYQPGSKPVLACGSNGLQRPEMLFRHYGQYLKEYDGRASIKDKKALF